MSEEALGLIETIGFVGVFEAADAAMKAAQVTLGHIEHMAPGYVCLEVRGSVADVTAAVEAGARAAERVAKLVGAHVIPRPDTETEKILPKTAPKLLDPPPGAQAAPRPKRPPKPAA